MDYSHIPASSDIAPLKDGELRTDAQDTFAFSDASLSDLLRTTPSTMRRVATPSNAVAAAQATPGFVRRLVRTVKTVIRRGVWQERTGLYFLAIASIWSLRNCGVHWLRDLLRVPFHILTFPLLGYIAYVIFVMVRAFVRAFKATATPEPSSINVVQRVKAFKQQAPSTTTSNPLKQAFRDLRGEPTLEGQS